MNNIFLYSFTSSIQPYTNNREKIFAQILHFLHLTITSIYRKSLQTVPVEDRIYSGRPSTVADNIINEVEDALNREPQTSVRKIDRAVNISKDRAHHNTHNTIGFKPYMMHCTQQLYDEDMNLRVEMSERLIPILADQANKGNVVFFSDESSFYVSGMVNKHNCFSWAANSPFIAVEATLNSPKINVWCPMPSK